MMLQKHQGWTLAMCQCTDMWFQQLFTHLPVNLQEIHTEQTNNRLTTTMMELPTRIPMVQAQEDTMKTTITTDESTNSAGLAISTTTELRITSMMMTTMMEHQIGLTQHHTILPSPPAWLLAEIFGTIPDFGLLMNTESILQESTSLTQKRPELTLTTTSITQVEKTAMVQQELQHSQTSQTAIWTEMEFLTLSTQITIMTKLQTAQTPTMIMTDYSTCTILMTTMMVFRMYVGISILTRMD